MRTTAKMYLETNPLLVDTSKLFELLMEEIEPIRYMLDMNTDLGKPTDPQLRGFGPFMSRNIQQAKNRIPILQAITGNPLYESTKQMTMGTMSILIDVLTKTVRVETVGSGDAHNEWYPSDWFVQNVPGIEHLVILEGNVCPPQFWRPGIVGTEY